MTTTPHNPDTSRALRASNAPGGLRAARTRRAPHAHPGPGAPMTDRQEEVLKIISASVEERGYPPSLREIAARLGVAGTRAVEKHIEALERKGRLRRGGGARALEIAGRTGGRMVPIVGAVAAGTPILAEENITGALLIDTALAKAEGMFLLRVKGDSMTGAGILDGDLVLVRPQPNADPGEIVVAIINEEATVKRFARSRGAPLLRAENPAYAPIPITERDRARIVGKVAGVFRF